MLQDECEEAKEATARFERQLKDAKKKAKEERQKLVSTNQHSTTGRLRRGGAGRGGAGRSERILGHIGHRRSSRRPSERRWRPKSTS